MRELLSRWAELEPERCEKSVGKVFTVKTESGGVKSLYDFTELDLAWIEWAIQEAIVSRGWRLFLGYDPTLTPPYEAGIEYSSANGVYEQADSLAKALLAAYLKALEAV